MIDPELSYRDAARWAALLGIMLILSLLFFSMVRPFLTALVLAAIFSALMLPLNRRISSVVGGRSGLASALTLLLMTIAVVAPLLGIIYIAAEQAIAFSRGMEGVVDAAGSLSSKVSLPDWVPFREELMAAIPTIREKVGSIVDALAGFIASSLGAVTRGTADFFLGVFVFLYATFFFLQMEVPIFRQIIRFTGLAQEVQQRLEDRAISVSRATIKGTLLIGLAQGALGGVGFWAVGIDGFVLWGVVMAVLSVIPGLGPTFVVACGVVYLLVNGEGTKAVGLAVWGAAVVGTIDNVLRPVLVGRDAGLHDLFILIGTLGGIAAFGAAGLILGPIVAGLFVTIWTTFSEASGEASVSEAQEPRP